MGRYEKHNNEELIILRNDISYNPKTKKINCKGKKDSDFRDFVDAINYMYELDDDIIHHEYVGCNVENIW